mmetsp:Transcript_6837/g.14923  ORF Transcript_6837/g.14923 Transcript_6837/m.14923 type:complete len:138 (+) Transcript_6837:49-462(+)|eukprot:CAMPEP_0178556068 /NCGR_PEP_ID=MMETSP0697-20121206/9191_1 /TAXON_ID=265572 /ORGANISM="Extubocellulus spinifer, Strain CCMP396" /LENGTH=137 /DNA_ID=CAMNT_0020189103 /DNA_START=79 /DNA_END=492 /DNA_ORIENTATION=-
MIRRSVVIILSLLAGSSAGFVVSNVKPTRQAIRISALSDHGPNKPGKLPIHHLDPHPTSSSVEHGVVGTAPSPGHHAQDPHGVVEHGVVGVAEAELGKAQDPRGAIEHGLMAEKPGRMPNLDKHPTSSSVEHTLLKP